MEDTHKIQIARIHSKFDKVDWVPAGYAEVRLEIVLLKFSCNAFLQQEFEMLNVEMHKRISKLRETKFLRNLTEKT